MRRVTLGRISGTFGVRGWVKVHSYTRPPENALGYTPWFIGGTQRKLLEGRRHGAGLVARLEGVEDRDAAAVLLDADIEVERDVLPPLPEGQYYWVDLIGLTVECDTGELLGRVEMLTDNGVQDVLVVRGEREHLIPFVQGPIVRSVDLTAGRIVVNWGPDF